MLMTSSCRLHSGLWLKSHPLLVEFHFQQHRLLKQEASAFGKLGPFHPECTYILMVSSTVARLSSILCIENVI
jgi:hypothetical protein